MFVQEKVKSKMSKKNGSDKEDSYWNNVWGSRKEYQSTGIDCPGRLEFQSNMI